MAESRYSHDPDYGKPPNWTALYRKHFPAQTDPWSRHARIIAQDILRDTKSPVRRLLIDAGYEPDHWASAIEATVQSLWETRAWLAEADPVGVQKRRDQQLRRAIRRAKPAA